MSSRQLVGKVCLLFVAIAFCAIVGEGFLRLFPGLLSRESLEILQGDPGNRGVSHPYIGHLHKPASTGIIAGSDFKAVHHTDGYGFRNAWPWPEEADIVAVGDSLTFGYGVEDDESWPAVIAQALPQRGVINLGLIGAGPQQYLRVYETFGTRLRPKLLLVGLFARNDFNDADLFDQWLRSGAEGNYMVWRDFGRVGRAGFSLLRPVPGIKGALRRKSYLYQLLREARAAYRRWWASEPRVFQFADGARLQLMPSQMARQIVGARPNGREFQLVLQALERLQSIAEQNDTRVLIIFQPGKEEVYMPLLGKAAPDPGGPLRASLERAGIAYLDLTQAFRQRAAAGEQLFFEADGHPNRQGYRLIAQEVLEHLGKEASTYGLDGMATQDAT